MPTKRALLLGTPILRSLKQALPETWEKIAQGVWLPQGESIELPPPREQGLFPAQDGTSLFYEVRGEGRPLILCYGLTCRREHWRHQIIELTKKYQVITFDYRGHHRSSVPANDRHLTLDWCARDVQALMDHLKLTEAVCLGHSMGVPVVALAGVKESTRIKGTVLICGAVTNPFEHMFFSRRMGHVYRLSAWLYENMPEVFSAFWRKFTDKNIVSYFMTSRYGFNREVCEERDVLMYMEGVNQTALSTFQTLLNDYVNCNGKELLQSLKCPSLVVAGGDDFITPLSVQKEMAAWLPNSQLVIIERGSHNAHMDYPSLVNEHIYQFLRKIGYE